MGEFAQVGQGKAFKMKWIKKEGERLVRLVESVKDETREHLQNVSQGILADQNALKDLKKRQLIDKG